MSYQKLRQFNQFSNETKKRKINKNKMRQKESNVNFEKRKG